MPRQNRVTPFGSIIAVPARGTLMGNRGCLHDETQTIRRPFQGTRWIICALDFKGRKRTLMAPGRYTELFFLDEATALAAGHRPCAECQRDRFARFREIWAAANPERARTRRPLAAVIDAVLHEERTAPRGLRSCLSIDGLPDGVFVTDDEQSACLIVGGEPRRWSPDGYADSAARLQYPVRILTPPSVVRTLAAGYRAGIHQSASGGGSRF